jgi:hypothetical protein
MPSAHHRLAAAVQSVPLPGLTAIVLERTPESVHTRRNPPKPATAPPAQNEAPSPSPRRAIRHRLLAVASDPDERALLRACEDALEPTQTCHNLPEPARTRLAPTAPAQNEPRFPAPLTPRQLHAARLLVAGHTVKSAAAHLGVNRHTVSEWKKNPDFQAEVQRALQSARRQPHYFAPG